METEVLGLEGPGSFEEAARRAAAVLRRGGLAALPTETVYGLAANATDPVAVAGIYRAKGRPGHNPLIVHVCSLEMARACVREWPEAASKLAAAFWPGPLTLVLKRSSAIPDVVTAGGDTVGVRWPAHPFILAVIRECGFALAAPSANLSNQISPTTAGHVLSGLRGRVDLVVDGGASSVGIESTVVDATGWPLVVLRPGMIHLETLKAVAGEEGVVEAGEAPAGAPLASPGLLKKHYAPRARLVVRAWTDEADLERQAAGLGASPKRTHLLALRLPRDAGVWGAVAMMPTEAGAYARALYAELHRCDAAGAEWILAEAPPEGAAWRGVADRLRRASA